VELRGALGEEEGPQQELDETEQTSRDLIRIRITSTFAAQSSVDRMALPTAVFSTCY
jgi:hypothetical protein